MAKWRISVPPPKAKRMAGSGKLIIHFSMGWNGGYRKEYNLQDSDVQWDHTPEELEVEGAGFFEFDVPDDFEWIDDTSISDGDTFDIVLEYTNSNKTRKEHIRPVPERIL